jgi:hypothetical protein
MIIVEDPIVTVECRTTKELCSFTLNLDTSVMVDSFSISFTSISFLTNYWRINVAYKQNNYIDKYVWKMKLKTQDYEACTDRMDWDFNMKTEDNRYITGISCTFKYKPL